MHCGSRRFETDHICGFGDRFCRSGLKVLRRRGQCAVPLIATHFGVFSFGAASKAGFFEFPQDGGSPSPSITSKGTQPEEPAMERAGLNLIPGQSFTHSVLQRQTENLKDLYKCGGAD